MENKDAFKFSGKDAENYDFYLGPIFFEPYGKYLASQIDLKGLTSVLEIACGTGRVTRQIRKALPEQVKFVATDISSDMLDVARHEVGTKGIEYSVEDAQSLSFADNTFDLVVCQFGIMFLPDKKKGLGEIYRVLKPGGKLMLFTWDDTLNMPLHKILVNDIVLPLFKGEDTSPFMVPFSMNDPAELENLVSGSGFKNTKVKQVSLKGSSVSAQNIVNGLFRKHSLGKEVMTKDPAAFEPLAQQFEEEIINKFGAVNPEFNLSAFLTVGEK